MTNPTDPWHERWMRLKHYIWDDLQTHVGLISVPISGEYTERRDAALRATAETDKQILSEMARMEKER